MIIKRQKFYSELRKKKKLFGLIGTVASYVGNNIVKPVGKIGLGAAGVAGVAGVAAMSNLASGAEQGANNGI